MSFFAECKVWLRYSSTLPHWAAIAVDRSFATLRRRWRHRSFATQFDRAYCGIYNYVYSGGSGLYMVSFWRGRAREGPSGSQVSGSPRCQILRPGAQFRHHPVHGQGPDVQGLGLGGFVPGDCGGYRPRCAPRTDVPITCLVPSYAKPPPALYPSFTLPRPPHTYIYMYKKSKPLPQFGGSPKPLRGDGVPN